MAPIGGSVLGWGFAVAALSPLVLGRGPRFGWAARLWSVTVVFWLAAWVVGRGWTGNWAPDITILLAPAAVAVASSIGLGIAALEVDVPRATFGWRQIVTALAAAATVLAAVPTVVSALPGNWNLPADDFGQALSWMHGRTGAGAFRVLWLGDPRALNLGSWAAGGGLAYATSEDGPADTRWLWNPPGAGPAANLAAAMSTWPATTGPIDWASYWPRPASAMSSSSPPSLRRSSVNRPASRCRSPVISFLPSAVSSTSPRCSRERA